MKRIALAAAVLAAFCISSTALAGSPSGFTPVKLHAGTQSPAVAELQMFLRLNTRGNFYKFNGGYTGYFGSVTVTSLKRWQTAFGRKPTGSIVIGSSQWNQLKSEMMQFRLAGYIDPQAIGAARQDGWAVDASKSPSMVNVLHYDAAQRRMSVTLSISAAYAGVIGGVSYTTDNGVFHIYAEMGPNFVSHEYNNAPMPYAACFNGSQCLHYDGLFPSHGCIHIPSWSAAQYIDRLPIGTTVVVHE